MFAVRLSNGDRATAHDEASILFAAKVLRTEAVANGCSPRIGRETIITESTEADGDNDEFDGVYHGRLTEAARNGLVSCS